MCYLTQAAQPQAAIRILLQLPQPHRQAWVQLLKDNLHHPRHQRVWALPHKGSLPQLHHLVLLLPIRIHLLGELQLQVLVPVLLPPQALQQLPLARLSQGVKQAM